MTDMIKRALKAISYIEDNLNDDIRLANVSESACYSHYHFLRIFHAITGITAGTYIRRRRLTKASEDLILAETRIIEIAQDAGFESQEAFSRAFKDMFGIPPAQFRKQKNTSMFRGQPAITETFLQHLQTRGITMEPYFETKEALTFIGIGQDFNLTEPNKISELWDQFLLKKHLIQNVLREDAYGLCYAPKEKETLSNLFHYTAALRVSPDAAVPEGMEKIQIEDQEYAVFTHNGSSDTLSTTNDYIWKTWLPKSGLELSDAPDIEIYGEKWSAETASSEMKILVPICRAGGTK